MSPACRSGVWRASPKSRILTRPSFVRKRFSGLRSRWTIPFSCAAPRPCAIWIAYSTALRTDSAAVSESRSQRLALEQFRDGVRDAICRSNIEDREN